MTVRIPLYIAVAAILSSCGIKPGSVEPPSGQKSAYPRSYPNPALDMPPVPH